MRDEAHQGEANSLAKTSVHTWGLGRLEHCHREQVRSYKGAKLSSYRPQTFVAKTAVHTWGLGRLEHCLGEQVRSCKSPISQSMHEYISREKRDFCITLLVRRSAARAKAAHVGMFVQLMQGCSASGFRNARQQRFRQLALPLLSSS